MSYTSNKAEQRDANQTDVYDFPQGAAASASKQEKVQSASAKARTISTASNPKFEIGNQVRVQANNKGTGVVGVPVPVAFERLKKVEPAVENPDRGANRDGQYATRVANKSRKGAL